VDEIPALPRCLEVHPVERRPEVRPVDLSAGQAVTSASGRRAVVLVGLPGSGKTTVGRIVADMLRWRHVDTDELVQSATGRTVTDIFTDEGEEAFRDYEHRAIVEALSQSAVVVSAGGGAVTHVPSRAVLAKTAPVVWLRADPATLVARLPDPEVRSRPLLGADPAASLNHLARCRAEWYRQVADAVVDVDGLTAIEVAGHVLRLVGSVPEAATGSVADAATTSVPEAATGSVADAATTSVSGAVMGWPEPRL